MKSVGLVQIFCPVKETNRTHSQSYVEDLSTQTGRKRCAKTAVLNLSVLPYIFVKRSLSVEDKRKIRALWTCRTPCGGASAAEHSLCSDEFAAVRCASARKGTRITRSGDRQSVVEHFSHTVPYTKTRNPCTCKDSSFFIKHFMKIRKGLLTAFAFMTYFRRL